MVRLRKMREYYSLYSLPSCAITTAELDDDSKDSKFRKMVASGRYVVYTQIDVGKGCGYVKGWILVNRTGVYALMPRVKEDDVSGVLLIKYRQLRRRYCDYVDAEFYLEDIKKEMEILCGKS